MKNTALKYFLYARKSSESEDRQMASIEDQIAEVKKVAERLNLKFVDIISEAKSAKEPGRNEFNKMLSRIQKGEAQGILTWKLNRLARNPIDGGQISWMLQKNIIQSIQTFEREYKPSDNVLLMQVEFGMANQYVKDLSLDVKRGMRHKAERGWYPQVKLPIGYAHNPRYSLGENEIVVDPEQFGLVKKLWKLLLIGEYSIMDIKRNGDQLGLKNRLKQPYSQSAYYKLFTNEFYCGYFYWKDKDGNINRYKGKHKVMISPADFHKVQLLLGERGKAYSKRTRYDFPYRMLISCGECGCMVSPDHKLQVICTNCKYKYSIKTRSDCPRCQTELSEMKNPSKIDILYYQCSKSKGKCSQRSITRVNLEKTIEDKLKSISIDRKFYLWALEQMNKENVDVEEIKETVRSLKKRKTELENRLLGIINLRADGDISAEQFNTSKSEIQKELSSIEFETERNKNLQNNWNVELKKKLDFALTALKKFQEGDDSVRNNILVELSANLSLKEKNLEITIRNGYLVLKDSFSAYMSKKLASNLKLILKNMVKM